MAAPAPAPAAAPVAIRAPDGTLGTVAARDLPQAIDAGASVATPEELRADKLEQEYGGLGGAAIAGGAGVLRGATLGLSDPAIVALGGDRAREALAGYQEANPLASGAGEVAGVIAPALLSGGGAGAGALARGAVRGVGLPTRAAAALGGAAERGVARLVGEEAAGLGARVLQRGAALGAQGAVEGALYGAGQEISEATLENHPLIAEKLFAAAGKGALFGAGGAAALGAAGTVAARGAKKLGELAAGAATREGETIGGMLDRLSGEFAFRSAGGRKSLTEGANKYAGGYDKVGRIWRDEAPGLVGKARFADMTVEDLAGAAAAGMKREGAALDTSLSRLDEIAAKNGRVPRAADVIGDIEGVAAELGKRAGTEGVVAKLQNFADSAKRVTGMVDAAGNVVAPDVAITLRQLRDLRVDADRIWAGNNVNPELFGYKLEFKRVRDALEGRLLSSADEASKYAGEDLRKAYELSKERYQAFKLLEKATESGQGKAGTNRFLSLTDNIQGAVGGAVGSALGGPVGYVAGNAAGALTNRFIRTRGDFLASDMLGQLSKLAAVERTVAKVDAQLETGIKGFLAQGRRQVIAAGEFERGRTTRAEAARIARDLPQLAANPPLVQERTARFLGSAADDAPNITSHAAMLSTQAIANLAARAPRPVGTDATLTPALEHPRIHESKLDEFREYLDGVKAPLSLLGDMARGRISRAKVDAVRDNFPQLFAQIQTQILKRVNEAKTRPDYAKRVQLGTLFGVPTDWTLEPGALKALQASYGGDGQADADVAPDADNSGPSRPLRGDQRSERMATQSEQIEGGT